MKKEYDLSKMKKRKNPFAKQLKKQVTLRIGVDILDEQIKKDKQNEFCGMWKDRTDMNDVERYVQKLRKGRSF
ncbi:MAG: hypothetical protein QTN59_01745 [Candidatus Electrothrix communis]|nr:MAG: hypothetical protein QTN59_01745 [Candidatus Electrothrix communis]